MPKSAWPNLEDVGPGLRTNTLVLEVQLHQLYARIDVGPPKDDMNARIHILVLRPTTREIPETMWDPCIL